MKLLAIGLSCHDTNYTYFDGRDIHYHKLERSKQIKHLSHSGQTEWIDDVKDIWGIDIDTLDGICIDYPIMNEKEFVDRDIFENFPFNKEYDSFKKETKFLLEKLFNGAINYFQAPEDLRKFYGTNNENLWVIGHYYAHSISGWMMVDNPDMSVVIDGAGDREKSYGIYRNNELVCSGSMEESIGIAHIMLSMITGVTASHPLDCSGKLMGLQSYGKVDKELLSILRNVRTKDILGVQYKGDKIDFAATVHRRLQEIVLGLFEQNCSKKDVIFYSGGVAQNVLWNTELRKHFPNLIVAPHCSDEGLSIGGIELLRRLNKLPKFMWNRFPYAQNDTKVEEPSIDTIKRTAELLAAGKIVAWYQGNGEIGPRALGNRSILMDPRIKNGRELINNIKKREHYRPFGASVLAEHCDTTDEYMLFTTKQYNKLPAITHVDGTCRLQTVKDRNPVFRKLLEEFNRITGCPVLLNTSLNLAGKPIAAHPDDAKKLYDTSSIDVLVIGNELVSKDF
jgi:carbamoyltransferase